MKLVLQGSISPVIFVFKVGRKWIKWLYVGPLVRLVFNRHKRGAALWCGWRMGNNMRSRSGLEASPILSTSWRLGTKHRDRHNLYQTTISSHELFGVDTEALIQRSVTKYTVLRWSCFRSGTDQNNYDIEQAEILELSTSEKDRWSEWNYYYRRGFTLWPPWDG